MNQLLRELIEERDGTDSHRWFFKRYSHNPQFTHKLEAPKPKVHHPPCHFTDDQIKQIRTEQGLLREIAAKYGASISWIWKVRHGQKRASHES